MALWYSDLSWSSGAAIILLFLILGFVLYSIAVAIYNVTLHPLANIPGPTIRGAFYFPYYRDLWVGKPVVRIRALHDRYGNTVRTSPTTVSFTTVGAWDDIYIDRVGKKAIPKDQKLYVNQDGIADLIGSNDADHARIRRLVSHALSNSAIHEQESLQTPYYEKLIKKLHMKIDGPTRGKVNLVHWLTFTTFDLIGDLCFGESFDALEKEEYNFWISDIFKGFKVGTLIGVLAGYPLFTAPILYLLFRFPSLERAKQKHVRYSTDKAVRRLERITDRKDLMSYILRYNDEKGMTKEEIIKLSTNLIIGGSEPVATTLCGAVYYLLKNPDKLAKLTTELRSSITDPSEMSFRRLEDMEYLDACIQEATRKFPPIPSVLPRRTLAGGAIINGYFIPEDVGVGVHLYSAFHSKENFAEPDAFIPERWLGDPNFSKDERSAHNPFSIGRRNCLGQHLARAQVRSVLARLVWHFDMTLCNESERWDDQRVFIFWDKPDLMIQLARRSL